MLHSTDRRHQTCSVSYVTLLIVFRAAAADSEIGGSSSCQGRQPCGQLSPHSLSPRQRQCLLQCWARCCEVMASTSRLLVVVVAAVTGVLGRHGSSQPSAEQLAELRRGPCPGGWTYAQSRCYRLSPQPAVFRQADSLCDMLSPSARLAVAGATDTSELMRALYREAARTKPLPRRPLPALWVRHQPQEFTRRARKLAPSQSEYFSASADDAVVQLASAPAELSETAKASASSSSSLSAPSSPSLVPLERRTMVEDSSPKEDCPVLQIGGSQGEGSDHLQCRSLLHYVCEMDATSVNETDL